MFNKLPFIVLVLLSAQTYQRSVLARRSPFFWIPLLWIVAIVGGIAAQFALLQIDPIPAGGGEAISHLKRLAYAELLGQVAGGAIVTYAAGRSVHNRTDGADEIHWEPGGSPNSGNSNEGP